MDEASVASASVAASTSSSSRVKGRKHGGRQGHGQSAAAAALAASERERARQNRAMLSQWQRVESDYLRPLRREDIAQLEEQVRVVEGGPCAWVWVYVWAMVPAAGRDVSRPFGRVDSMTRSLTD